MLNYDHSSQDLKQAFNLTEDSICKTIYFLKFYDECKNVSRAVERIWIDETIDDNTRAFTIMTLGRYIETEKMHKRIEGGE